MRPAEDPRAGDARLVQRMVDPDAPTREIRLPGAPTPPPRRPRPRHAERRTRADRRHAELTDRKLRRRRIRRIAALLLVTLLMPVAWSYYNALAAPGTDPWAARSVEWLRDHGMSGIVDTVEHWWYTNNPPPVGGKPKNGLPQLAGPNGVAVSGHSKGTSPAQVAHLPIPVAMRPLVATPLPREGVWQATGREVAGLPAVYTTFFRPDSVHTSLVAGAMWMDTKLLRAAYVVGLKEAGGPQTWGAEVPVAQRSALVAAFNSGFKIASARGGVYTEGQAVVPLVDGAASFVIDKSGHIAVGMWGRDFKMGPNIASVRQNLALILDKGKPAPGLPSNTNGAWGDTLGNKVFVWRSGVGIDRHGGLVYVAGPGLSAVTLAVLLQRAGAVRAMELDINPNWTSAYTYAQTDPSNPAAIQGVKLLQDMIRSGDRYLQPGERDFFAMLAAH